LDGGFTADSLARLVSVVEAADSDGGVLWRESERVSGSRDCDLMLGLADLSRIRECSNGTGIRPREVELEGRGAPVDRKGEGA
jgi:hypothetical protein